MTTAATADEFVLAVGSNRIIEVAGTSLDLGGVQDRYMKHIRWDFGEDGRSVTIRDVENLTIKGAGRARTRVVAPPTYEYVLRFENARGVRLADMTVGHVPEGRCSGGVIAASDCDALKLERCALFGCGTEGLTLRGVSNSFIEDSEIFDCTSGVATIESCEGVTFVRSTFRNNKEYHGIRIRDSQLIEFIDSAVRSNFCSGDLFDVISSSDIRFVRGLIADNHCMAVGRIDVVDADVQDFFLQSE